MNQSFTDYDPTSLPASVLIYLDAHDEKRHVDAAAVFTADSTVLDDGSTYEGIQAIRDWMERSSTEYTYTSTRISQQVVDEDHTAVQIRIDGNFPGGTATLRYQFELQDGLIRRLAIEV